MSRKRKVPWADVHDNLPSSIGPLTAPYWRVLLRDYVPSLPKVLIEVILNYMMFSTGLYSVVDVLDKINAWHPAVIVAETTSHEGETHVTAHFWSWSDMHDEILSLESDRIAPLGVHTGSKCTTCQGCHWWERTGRPTVDRDDARSTLTDRYAFSHEMATRAWYTLCHAENIGCHPCSSPRCFLPPHSTGSRAEDSNAIPNQ